MSESEEKLSQVFSAFKKSFSSPCLVGGSVEGDNRVWGRWKGLSVEEGKKVGWKRCSVRDEVGKWVELGPFVEEDDVVERSSNYSVVKYGEKGAKEEGLSIFLRVFEKNSLKRSEDLTPHHGDLYPSESAIGSFEEDENEGKLAYIAERKRKKNVPFHKKVFSSPSPSPSSSSSSSFSFSSRGNNNGSKSGGKEEEEEKSLGSEYDFLDSWGEELQDKVEPCIVTYDPHEKSGTPFRVISYEALGNSYLPIKVVWKDSNTLVGIGVEKDLPYKVGLRYCTNRPSVVFEITSEGKHFKIINRVGEGSRHRFEPRVRNSDIFWFEREMKGSAYNAPHCANFNLVMKKGNGQNGGEVEVIVSSSGKLFISTDAPKAYFLNNEDKETFIILNTILDGHTFCPAVINVREKSVRLIEDAKNIKIFQVRHGRIIGCKSTPLEPWSLVSSSIANLSFEVLQTSNTEFSTPDDIIYKPLIQKSTTGNAKKFNSVYIGPSLEKKESKIPLIVIPHGGPHSLHTTSFSCHVSFFIELGFGILLVNFRGSLGADDEDIFGLLGRVGFDDVADCLEATKNCLEEFRCLDKEKVVLFGGSHGGFLVTHLSGQSPDTYKATVAINPVTDISTVVRTSCIPDWGFVEAGLEFDYKNPITPEVMKIMWEKSPIRYAEYVKAPVYLMIGTEDKTVPPSQGIEYYRRLKGMGKDVTMSFFPDGHSLSKPPVHINMHIKSALFFLKSLKL